MKFSDAEWTVMRALWAGAPATGREVLERCAAETGWAYTTVKTLLSRLAEKGALKVERRGNVDWFRPAVTERRARRTAFRSLLDRAFDGTIGGLLHHLVRDEPLSAAEREQLRAVLRELDGGAAPGGAEDE